MNRYKNIIEYFGIDKQQRKFTEECFELNEAITMYEVCLTNEWDTPLTKLVENGEMIKEEIADCLVLLSQFIAYYNIDKDELEKIIKYKVERTEQRIKDGYYEKIN